MVCCCARIDTRTSPRCCSACVSKASTSEASLAPSGKRKPMPSAAEIEPAAGIATKLKVPNKWRGCPETLVNVAVAGPFGGPLGNVPLGFTESARTLPRSLPEGATEMSTFVRKFGPSAGQDASRGGDNVAPVWPALTRQAPTCLSIEQRSCPRVPSPSTKTAVDARMAEKIRQKRVSMNPPYPSLVLCDP